MIGSHHVSHNPEINKVGKYHRNSCKYPPTSLNHNCFCCINGIVYHFGDKQDFQIDNAVHFFSLPSNRKSRRVLRSTAITYFYLSLFLSTEIVYKKRYLPFPCPLTGTIILLSSNNFINLDAPEAFKPVISSITVLPKYSFVPHFKKMLIV